MFTKYIQNGSKWLFSCIFSVSLRRSCPHHLSFPLQHIFCSLESKAESNFKAISTTATETRTQYLSTNGCPRQQWKSPEDVPVFLEGIFNDFVSAKTCDRLRVILMPVLSARKQRIISNQCYPNVHVPMIFTWVWIEEPYLQIRIDENVFAVDDNLQNIFSLHDDDRSKTSKSRIGKFRRGTINPSCKSSCKPIIKSRMYYKVLPGWQEGLNRCSLVQQKQNNIIDFFK